MKSHYKRIGDYIQLVDERNTGLKVTTLLGLTISKQFIPSVANIIGTDMENYKIIRKNQFACSTMQVRRDRKMPVALLQDFDEAIISPAYPVFEVIDSKKLLPEYLMMWFSRAEFDREALFYAVGGVRGSLEWEDFCNMTLPIPSPDKQREIVAEYNTILQRIDLNNRLIQKLEETAQSIYKQWFVDFEFPNENGEPYKSTGGEMVESGLGDIPKGWKAGSFKDVSTLFTGFSFDGAEYSFDDGISVLRGENVTEKKLRWDTHKKWNTSTHGLETYFLKEFDVVIGMDGSKVGKNWAIVSKYDLPLLLAQRVACVRAINPNWQFFVYYSLLVCTFDKYVDQVQTGTSVPHISGDQILEFPIVVPESSQKEKYNSIVKRLLEHLMVISHQNTKLNTFGDLLLSKLATVTD